MAVIEYFYSTRSIYAYFGAARLTALARQFGRRIEHKPIDLSVVVPASGGTPFGDRAKQRQAYFFGREIERWSQYLGLPAHVDPKHHYGDRTLPSGIVLAAAELPGDAVNRLSHAILQALWRDDRDIADPAVLADLARSQGLDPDRLLERARSAEIQAHFRACTDEAVRRFILGSPTYVVDGDPFYGQDRLDLVERALQRPFAYSAAY
ncbi:MAG: 2-hydroxychromene-2-carboxylate isomerase [Alphaproteobacteria bacterium]|nr:2-hydroxychromene-2-carboxylate isomerase [Alphaproteobacteria bacterium]